MKFIIFNLAVGAALIYLFAADGPELERAAVRIQGVAGEIKDRAWNALDRARPQKDPSRIAAKAGDGKEPVPATSRAATTGAASASPSESADASSAERAANQIAAGQANPPAAEGSPDPRMEPAAAPKDAGSTDATTPPHVPSQAKPTPTSEPASDKTRLATSLPPVSEPAVARRRKEILRGIAPEGPRPVLKKGERLMSADERRKRLFSLAEEMELLYARSLSR